MVDGPVGPRWAPCCPHEPCYQGSNTPQPTCVGPLCGSLLPRWPNVRHVCDMVNISILPCISTIMRWCNVQTDDFWLRNNIIFPKKHLRCCVLLQLNSGFGVWSLNKNPGNSSPQGQVIPITHECIKARNHNEHNCFTACFIMSFLAYSFLTYTCFINHM